MGNIKEVEDYFNQNKLDEAVQLIKQSLAGVAADKPFLLMLGKIHYKKQEWGEAINVYNQVLDFDPDNQEAKSNIEMANAILGYYTPDMFNP